MTSREDYARRRRIHLIIQPGLDVDEQPKYTFSLSIPVDKIMVALGNYWLWKGARKMLFLCWDFTWSDVLSCQFNDANLSKTSTLIIAGKISQPFHRNRATTFCTRCCWKLYCEHSFFRCTLQFSIQFMCIS